MTQPEKSVVRYGRASFSWNGGHPAIDAPPDRRLVTTQRLGRKRWKRVATDDGFYDILERDPETDVWTTTFQTTECMRAGTYRFLIPGRADTGAGPADYRLESDTFELAPITNIAPTLSRRRPHGARDRALPGPGRGGHDPRAAAPGPHRLGGPGREAEGKQREKRVRARLTKDRLAFQARVPRGAKVRVIRVKDGCGNRSA